MRNERGQRPPLHVVRPQSSSGEHVVRDSIIGVTLAGIIAIAAWVRTANQQPRESILPEPPPISGPRVPGVAATEQEKQKIPIEAQLFMKSLKTWRQSLPENNSVTLFFFPDGIESEVISEIGANRREEPTTQSRIIGAVRWGHSVESPTRPVRFMITIRNAYGKTEEEWLGYREDERYPNNNPQRFADMDFVATETREDGGIVRVIIPPQQNIISVPWPRTNQ